MLRQYLCNTFVARSKARTALELMCRFKKLRSAECTTGLGKQGVYTIVFIGKLMGETSMWKIEVGT